MSSAISCRICHAPVTRTFVDLGVLPLSNAFIERDQANAGEVFFPLHAFVCDACFLVQVAEYEQPANIFNNDYVYFSSYSQSWLDHAARYTEAMIERFGLGDGAHVVEVASNDGYLLQYFLQRDMTVTGIEPAGNCAAVARQKGVHTEVTFFGAESGRRIRDDRGAADLIAANNVLAHVPEIDDFVAGFGKLMKPEGVTTFEFPHLMRLIEFNQFDTIYHEHFSYLSLRPLRQVFAKQGLRMFDVEELPTHGGSLRLFVCHRDAAHADSPAVAAMLSKEKAAGLEDLATYESFATNVIDIKDAFLTFLVEARRAGKTVAAYGAAAKGNTMINFCGVGPDHIAFVVDRNPAKQDRLMPGSRIPVYDVSAISQHRPDYLILLPWNLRDEIVEQMAEIRSWGGRFVTAIPRLDVF
ncbi:MAG: class I SAM-dependent methyltransferase [Proteobacteria bacterium]|nr:class I SAM-dependent methyltransferase [Pseudomonadota bacterium]